MLKKVRRWLTDKVHILWGPSINLNSEDTIPLRQKSQSQEVSNNSGPENDNDKSYPCQFCHQSGNDRFKSGLCRVCKGLGTVKRQYQNTVECGHCQGKGVEPYQAQQCKVCGGIGVIEKIEESLQKAPIRITYSKSESSGKRLDIDSSNEFSKATKKEQ